MTDDLTVGSSAPSAWIFQANPTYFDIDALLALEPETFLWRVNQGGSKMVPGAKVFLWRSIGEGDEALSGIVAEGEIVEPPKPQPDDPLAVPFWRKGSPLEEKPRVRIRLIRRATPKQVLRRKWIKADPIARTLRILQLRNETNYPLHDEHASRLTKLWSRIATEWTYAEAVAGLWAYQQSLGGSVSELPGSPVARVSELTGRPTKGVSNKVLNFRALDPRDAREGLPNTTPLDRAVWAKFFDPSANELSADLTTEFERLWSPATIALIQADTAQDEHAVRPSLKTKTLAELMARYATRGEKRNERNRRPHARAVITTEFDREDLIVAIAKARAHDKCEVPACAHPTFVKPNGETFVEVHHILPLDKGGADTPENVACICPAHHREAHYGAEATKIAEGLKALRSLDGSAGEGEDDLSDGCGVSAS